VASPGQSEKEKLLAHARELEQLGTELRAQFDAKAATVAPRSRWLRFLSRDRRYFWRMPVWLWVPLVLLLCVLFLVAFYSAARH